jgi:hypothetical protein
MSNSQTRRPVSTRGSENRLQAQAIKAKLKEAGLKPKELFPQKALTNHRRSDAFDATDPADLFASKMPVPFLDGSTDALPRTRDLMSRITKPKLEGDISSSETDNRSGLSIRGAAAQRQHAGFSIRGIASTSEASMIELFPHKVGVNSGKELFSEKLEGRGGRRRRAEDMFH